MTSDHWLDVFCAALGCDSSFAAALNVALGSEFRKLGLKPEGFFLAPLPNAQLSYASGVGHVDADLVGPDNFGHTVTIAFSCAHHPGERLDPRRPLGQGCALRATWVHLRVEMTRER